MSDKITVEAARLAMSLLRTTDPDDNHRALMMALRSFDEPMDRLAVHFHTARLLALELRETAKAFGTFDAMIAHIDNTLSSLVVDDEESTQ